MAVIPLEEYKKLISNKSQPNDQDDDDDDEIDDLINSTGAGEISEDQAIPAALDLVISCAPCRMQNRAMMLLRHMASLNGRLKYDMDTGEILIDDQPVPGSNLSDIIRILLTNRPNSSEPRESIGIRPFLKTLSKSPMPKNLIVDGHWADYFHRHRSVRE
jgi:hypothetical protein